MLDWLLSAVATFRTLTFSELFKLAIAGFCGLLAALIWSASQNPAAFFQTFRDDPAGVVATREGDCYLYHRSVIAGGGLVLADYVSTEPDHQLIVISLFPDGAESSRLAEVCKAMIAMERT